MDKIYNAIIFLLLFASAAMACLFYVKWLGVREENIERRLDESRLRYNVAKLSDEKAYKEEYYYRLVHDDAFAERVIREKLGFVGKNELVFRFKDSTPVSVDTNFGRTVVRNAENRAGEAAASQTEGGQPAPQAQAEEQTEPAEEKSILRRLFSAADEPKKTETREQPSFKIDMSKPADGTRQTAATPAPQNAASAQASAAQQAAKPEEKPAAPARKKARTPNSIRFISE